MLRRSQNSARPVAAAVGFLQSPIELLEKRELLAGTPIVLESGKTYQGVIASPTDSAEYTFTASAGDTAAISFAGTASLGPQVELYGPNGALVATKYYNDNSRYENLTAGVYRIVLRDRADIFRDDCDYALTVVKLPGTHQLEAGEGPLTSGQEVVGYVERGDIDVYTFTAAAGSFANIYFRGDGTLGPQFELFDPAGRLMVEDYNANEGSVQNLSGGTYTILFRAPADSDDTSALLTAGSRLIVEFTAGSTAPTVSVAVDRATVPEDGPGVLRYTFTRTGSTASVLTVNFRASGTAVAGSDYFTTGANSFNGQAGTMRFAAGQATAVFVVSPKDDTAVEPHENVRVDLVAGTGYALGSPAFADAQILNDDSVAAATVTVAVSSPTVPEDGAGVLRYTFRRTGSTANALTVNFRTSGTAVAGSDYFTSGAASFTGRAGTMRFLAGQATTTFVVSPADDNIVEPHENVRVDLAAGTGYALGSPAFAGAQILNDDPAAAATVTVAVSSPTVQEDGTGVLRYTFRRTGSTANALTVNFRTSGTAVAGSDYFTSGAASFNGRAGTIRFLAGQATTTFVVSPADDNAVEPNENVRIDLVAGTGYALGSPAFAGALILNDDPAVTVAVSSPTVQENGPGLLRYVFRRTGSTANPLTVSFRVSGTAVAGSDYFTTGATVFNGRTGTIRFLVGQATVTFVISPADDNTVEPNENVRVDLFAGRLYTVGSPAFAGALILNDDPASSATAAAAVVAERPVPTDPTATSIVRVPVSATVRTILPPPAVTQPVDREPGLDSLAVAPTFTPPLWEGIADLLLTGLPA